MSQVNFLLLFIFIVSTLCLDPITIMMSPWNESGNESNSNRYKSIIFPNRHLEFIIRPKILKYTLIRMPIRKVYPGDGSIEICSEMDSVMKSSFPQEWNNTSIPNPCERYFCSQSMPPLLASSLNESISPESRHTSMNLHYKLHNYCTLCYQTLAENFTGSAPNNATTCQWWSNSCENHCDDSPEWGKTQCVFFADWSSLCYSWDYHYFVGNNDFLHHTMITIYIWTTSLVLFLAFLPLLIVCFLFLTVPECHWIYRKYREPSLESSCSRLSGLLFTFRTFYTLNIGLNIIQVIVFSALDLPLQYFGLGFTGRYRNASNFVTYGLLVLLFVFMVIQWITISNYSITNGKRPYLFWIFALVFMIFFIGWSLIGGSLYLLIPGSDSTTVGWGGTSIVGVFGGTWMFITIFVFFIILVMLIMYSIRILKSLLGTDLSGKTNPEMAYHIFQVKLTKVVFLFSIIILVSNLFGLYIAFQWAIGSDVFTIYVFFICNILLNIWIFGVVLTLILAFTEWNNLAETYPFCCYAVDNMDDYQKLDVKISTN